MARVAQVVRRDELTRPSDYLYTMRQARRRFAAERHLPVGAHGFRVWARKTYTPGACAGKLRAIVEVKQEG